MDQIGSSHIAKPDLIIFGGAIVLFYCLKTFPPSSGTARVAAVISGLFIVSVALVVPFANGLTTQGTQLLGYTGLWLGLGLWEWNRARTREKLTPANPPERQSS